MSSLLWKFYLEDDADQFRRLLADARYVAGPPGQKHPSGASSSAGAVSSSIGSASALASSPRTSTKHRKFTGWGSTNGPTSGKGQTQWSNLVVTRADINLKDRNGLTILHLAASSMSSNAIAFATALLDHPLIDLYLQDAENGWTVLHRALYFGNVTIARAVMDCDMRDAWSTKSTLGAHHSGRLIRVKDWEGNSPFDLLNATITTRSLEHRGFENKTLLDDDYDSDRSSVRDAMDGESDESRSRTVVPHLNLEGDTLFTFGSNKNLNLGLGDEDDRQFPELVYLTRPDHLLYRFYYEYQQGHGERSDHRPDEKDPIQTLHHPRKTSSLPSLIQNKPLRILDVALAKLHTAVLTDDPEANLYVCGFGPGGRLGTGDETTRFNLVCVEGGGLSGKKVVNIGLGQNHTLAITSDGEIFSWGANTYGQLGYALPKSTRKDDDPVQTSPRQIFGLLKRETVIGAAASRVHSVVHTTTSLFTFGKNEGQLGLVDSDARSLEAQTVPRRVAASLFSSPIQAIAAIDHASICLLKDHEVWVFANFGYAKLAFPLEGFTNYFLKGSLLGTRYDSMPNHISKIAAGGDTICALSRSGDVFTVNVSQELEPGPAASSTTNPSKIRNALTPPKRIWSLRKGHMAVRDVDVGQDGSVIICTDSGSVWRRVKRTKIKDASATGSAESKPKDYKFSRVPGLTRVIAVRSNTFGAYAAVRKDHDVTKVEILVNKPELWEDVAPLLPFDGLESKASDDQEEDDTPRFWTPSYPRDHFDPIKSAVLTVTDMESKLRRMFAQNPSAAHDSCDVEICTSISDVAIPVHQFILTGRSHVLRQGLYQFRTGGSWSLPDILTIQAGESGRAQIRFQGFDFLSIFNLVLYMYRDIVVDVWHFTRHAPRSAYRYRQVRTETMKIASRLELRELEPAVRVMRDPNPILHKDMEAAILDPVFFDDGDAVVELSDDQLKIHTVLMCQRCPFFEGLFQGRAAGKWLSARRDLEIPSADVVTVDLKHVDSSTFRLVLRYLYCDTGEELFDDVVTNDLDEFLDVVVDVLSVANELMLDRLSQICQKVLGRFVNTRNACQLLNAVSSCSVTEFKDACLEYLCLNLEAMLENHLLEELEDELLLELDGVVRANQLACLPIAKSGLAERELQEKFPGLAEARDLERRDKISAVAVRSRMAEDGSRSPGQLRAKDQNASPSTQRLRPRSSKDAAGQKDSPLLRSKTSTAELIFDMDEDDARAGVSQLRKSSSTALEPTPDVPPIDMEDSVSTGPCVDVPYDRNGNVAESNPDIGSAQSHASSFPQSMSPRPDEEGSQYTTTETGSPLNQRVPLSHAWAAAPLRSAKLDMREIMAQASSSRASNLSAGLSLQATQQEKAGSQSLRISQRERKKQQQQQQQQRPLSPPPPPQSQEKPSSITRLDEQSKGASPWQVRSSATKISLKDVLGAEEKQASERRSMSTSAKVDTSPRQRSTGQDGRPEDSRGAKKPVSTQHRSVSNPTVHKPDSLSHAVPRTESRSKVQQRHVSTPVSPSKPASPRTSAVAEDPVKAAAAAAVAANAHAMAEPSLQLSMADIISQQQAEQEVVRQTIAKRPLQDIQQEQEFMEWWDAESRKAKGEEEQEEEESRDRRGGRGGKEGKPRGRGKTGKSGGSTSRRAGRDKGSTDTQRQAGRGGGGGGGGGAGAGMRGGSPARGRGRGRAGTA
ncbi:MAG: hypothetical protein M1837_005487 [Sclerophora amabilis]|nr:MAG: hypothetical protein M1837_005487 [Sclerophora amabilis]